MPTTGQIIRARRDELGWSLRVAAARVGVVDQTWSRWERDERAIDFPGMAGRVSRVLGLTLDELAGLVPTGLDLGGEWRGVRWQTWRGGRPVIDRHGMTAIHSHDRITMDSTAGYMWRGEVKLIDNSVLGTYRSTEEDKAFRGALSFWLHPDSRAMIGTWAGRFTDGQGSGWGVIARDQSRADALIDTLIAHGPGPLTEWPRET